jgi:glyoxylase-like metal-dependent hydrolase (beta-lactamase superfamily II)
VDEIMRRDDSFRRDKWSPVFGDEWPASSTFANSVERDGVTIELAGMRFRAVDLGRGESESETAWILDGEEPVGFVGDLVFNGTHSYIGDGMTGEWIESLGRAKALLRDCRRILAGHGEAAGLDALQDQKSYLLMVRESISRLAGGSGRLSEADKTELTRLMAGFRPDPLEWLVTAGCEAVAQELKHEPAVPGGRG